MNHLRLFYVRCTLMAFHALMWSFVRNSKREFRRESLKVMTEGDFDRNLTAVFVTGCVFLAILAAVTLIGISLQSVRTHYFIILLHSLGIILVIIAILNYWNVRLLWLAVVFSCIVPAIFEIVYAVLVPLFRD
jgi:hypothetical protein